MSGHRKWAAIRRSERDPGSRERIERYKQELREALSLAELRRARTLTQTRLSETLGMQQSAISRIERQADLYVSTLRSYVEAMGGRLELQAVFPDARIPIGSFGSITPERPEDHGANGVPGGGSETSSEPAAE